MRSPVPSSSTARRPSHPAISRHAWPPLQREDSDMLIERRFFARLVVRLATAALISATCLGGAALAKPLVHAIPSDIASLDPADIRGPQDQEIGVNVYERLVQLKFNGQPDGSLLADPVEVVPQLAESWKVEGPVITFRLRPGVKFYGTGNPVTSATASSAWSGSSATARTRRALPASSRPSRSRRSIR